MEEGNQITVKMGSKYVGTLWSYTAPFKEYEPNSLTSVAQLKAITHLAMVGGDKIEVVKKACNPFMKH